MISDLNVWEKTLSDWRLNEYSSRQVSAMIERYRSNMVEMAKSDHRNKNAYVGAYETVEDKTTVRQAIELPPLPPQPDFFAAFKAKIETLVSAESFAIWFRPIGFVSMDSGVLTVRAPDRVFENWILNNYREAVGQAFEAVGAEVEAIKFEVLFESEGG